MRTLDISAESQGFVGTVTCPDKIALAFNPNYITIKASTNTSVLTLSFSCDGLRYDIDISFFRGEARCYMSKLFQIFFDDYVNVRSKNIIVSLLVNGTSVQDIDFLVVWGVLQLGMKYGYYLPFIYDRGSLPRQERRVMWFKNFPFKVSLFRENNTLQLYYVADGGNQRDISSKGSGVFEITPSDDCPDASKDLLIVAMREAITRNKFDADFEIPFYALSGNAYLVRLIVRNEVAGLYLRWIDQYGFWQYYLFTKGTRSMKNKLSSTTVDAEFAVEGMFYEAQRSQTIENTEELSCCAANLEEDILAYVQTIYQSPHIDIYLGRDANDVDLWQPVNIEAGTTKLAADRRLLDYEITISMQQTPTQIL